MNIIKKFTFGVLGTAFLASGLWACSDEFSANDANEDKFSLNENSNLRNRMDMNPFEYVGVEHNLFMEKFTKHLEESYQNGEWNDIEFLNEAYKIKFSEIMDLAYHSQYEYSTSTVSYQMDIYDQLDLDEWYDGDEITPIDLANDVLENNASLKDKEFTLNLLNDIFQTTNNITDNELALIELEQVILRHEELILSEEWQENEDYALGALAVAKHSLIFWRDYDFTKITNYHAKGRNPRSAIVVGADSAGFVIGGGVGAASGSFLGPAGTVGGFLGGKAAGAWAGSTAALTAIGIYDAWNDYF